VLDRSAVGQLSSLSSRTKWQRLLAGDTSADLSNIGRPSGPTYSTGELLNMPLVVAVVIDGGLYFVALICERVQELIVCVSVLACCTAVVNCSVHCALFCSLPSTSVSSVFMVLYMY